jgi:hypothetical protein
LSQAERLRRDADDTFSAYFEERLLRVEELVGRAGALGGSLDGGDVVERTRDLEDFTRRELTRRGLNVLCKRGRREDAKRIRANLKSGYAEASKLDAEYLGKYGEWSDIAPLVKAGGPKPGGLLGVTARDQEYRKAVARAAYKIGRHSISKLLSPEMPAAILHEVVQLCAESRFSKISNDALSRLLDYESEEVRRAMAIKTVLSFPTKRIRSILDEYVSKDGQRYYNVIHWLDLGVSMSRDDARRVAGAGSGART